MSTENIDIRINATTRGQESVRQLNSSLQSMDGTATKMQRSWATGAAAIAAGSAGFYVAAQAVGVLWGALKEGTAIQFAQTRFENLAVSVGTTSQSMMNSLRAATSGMYSDMQLVDSANQIMAVGLANSEQGVVRMATAVGKLGIDMNQLVLELNTMRGMRLDQMGLDIVVVQAKAAQLELDGMSQRAAYTEAVLQAMEEKIALQGDIAETSAGKVARAGATMSNAWNDVKVSVAELADNTGFLDWLDSVSQVSAANRELQTTLDGLVAAGEISEAQALDLTRAWGFSAETHAVAADTIARLTAGVQGEANAANSAATSTDNLTRSTVGAAQAAAQADMVMLTLATGINYLGGQSRWTAEQLGFLGSMMNKFHGRQAAMEGLSGKAAAGFTKMALGLDGVSMSAGGATGALGGYSAALDTVAQRQQDFVSAFSTELGTEFDAANDAMKERQAILEQGLINDEGVANITAINHAMFEQGKALGMSAGQLALYGIALGEFTEEQARAALKAAVIQQRIMDLSQAVAAGQMSFGDAVTGAQEFAVELDTTAAQTSVDDLATAVDQYASNGPYDASVNADVGSASNGLNAVIKLLDSIDGRTVKATAEVTTSQNGQPIPVTPDTGSSIPGNGRARGGPVNKGGTYWVGEHGPEQVTFTQPGYVHPFGQSPRGDMNVVVNNYISGGGGEGQTTATVTADTVKGALRRLGVG